MRYYCNFCVKDCNEELMKGLKYKKKGNVYNVSNHCDSNDFDEILKRFKDYKLMVFFAPDYDESFYLGFSDINSESLDNEIIMCPFDFHDENWFIDDYFPVDKFENEQIDEQTGIEIKVNYENPVDSWWNNNENLDQSIDRSKIIVEEIE